MKSIFGLNERIVALISYLGVFITGILAFILEKENRFVRFHALQSTVTFGALFIIVGIINLVRGILSAIPFLGWLVSGILGLVVGIITILGIILWIYLMYTAWQGKEVRLPIIGDVVWAQVNK